jgi:cbb3-type cytochrome oxidase subunit 3
MTFFIFAGDMLVMAFMFGLVVWVFMRAPKESMEEAANIPLEDEDTRG